MASSRNNNNYNTSLNQRRPLLVGGRRRRPSEEEEEEEEEGEEEETEEEEEYDRNDEDYLPSHPTLSPQHVVVIEEDSEGEEEGEEEEEEEEELGDNGNRRRKKMDGGEGTLSTSQDGDERESNDVGTSSCTICMESWSSGGAHRTCCLPCGHLYGRSCIEKWIRQCKRAVGKCPQCNQKCKLNDIRNIYATCIAVVNEDLQKELLSLQSENNFLKMRNSSLLEEIHMHKKREMDRQVEETRKASRIELELLGTKQTMPLGWNNGRSFDEQLPSEHFTDVQHSGWSSAHGNIALKAEFEVVGARVLDLDISSQIVILCRRPYRMTGTHVFTKYSLLSPGEKEDIEVPLFNKPVKDIRLSPHSSRRTALVASLEKKASIFSLETNTCVMGLSLPAPAWSCAWDVNNEVYAYAGLQDGSVVALDMRQTREPLNRIDSLTMNPVHTTYSLPRGRVQSSPCAGQLITASSFGPCLWNFDDPQGRQFLVPGIENQGVCIALAHSAESGDVVATFRPKIHGSSDMLLSQHSMSPQANVPGLVTWGSHVLLKKTDNSYYQNHVSTQSTVSSVRMLKSTIISKEDCRLFVYGDDVSNRLVLRDLSSLQAIDHLKEHPNPILDVKYEQWGHAALLGCVSESKLQVYTCFGR